MGDLSYDVLTVFLVGMTGMWKGLSIGFILGVSPFYIFIATALSSILGVLVLFFFGTRIRKFLVKRRFEKGKSKKEKNALQLFEKYGHIGLGFFGALMIGPPMTIVLGLTLVKKQKIFLYWTLAGIVVWTLALTILGTFSVETITRIAR